MATIPATPPETSDGRQGPTRGAVVNGIVIAAILAACFYLAYEPSFRFLVDQWNRDPNYSYGFFVIPIALYIFWNRREMLTAAAVSPRWLPLMFLPFLAVVAVRHPLFEWNEQFAETSTIPLVAAALVFAVGGWALMRVAYPSLIFLLFMIPLPTSLNQWLAQPLQRLATLGSVGLLQILGLPVMSEGNVIIIGDTPLEVARACNGLSMLLSFVTLITAAIILIKRPLWERVVLMLSAVPIALISNILRITATAICYHRLGQQVGDKIAHGFAGFMMMPLALVLVWIELMLMSWVFQDVEQIDASVLLRKGRGGNPVAR